MKSSILLVPNLSFESEGYWKIAINYSMSQVELFIFSIKRHGLIWRIQLDWLIVYESVVKIEVHGNRLSLFQNTSNATDVWVQPKHLESEIEKAMKKQKTCLAMQFF